MQSAGFRTKRHPTTLSASVSTPAAKGTAKNLVKRALQPLQRLEVKGRGHYKCGHGFLFFSMSVRRSRLSIEIVRDIGW